jgi:hypothetical protein
MGTFVSVPSRLRSQSMQTGLPWHFEILFALSVDVAAAFARIQQVGETARHSHRLTADI